MLAVNMYYETKQVVRLGVADYLHSGWAYLELLNFFLSVVAIEMHLSRVFLIDRYLDTLADLHFSTYVSFTVPQILDQVRPK